MTTPPPKLLPTGLNSGQVLSLLTFPRILSGYSTAENNILGIPCLATVDDGCHRKTI